MPPSGTASSIPPRARLHFLQIWILPGETGLAPGYEQRAFPPPERRGRLRRVAGPDGAEGTLTLHQDARLYIGDLHPGEQVVHAIDSGRGVWVQVSRGIAALNGIEMRAGDGAAVKQESAIMLEADTEAQMLVFDLV